MTRALVRVIPLLSLLALLACFSDYSVAVPNGLVTVSRDFWRPMQNPEPFADNFEARSKRSNEEFEQSLTVYKAPIREDQRGDVAIGDRVYADVMVVHPPAVTIQVRVTHASHWVLSRQTFGPRPGVDPTILGPVLSAAQARALLSVYQDEVRRTQSILEALTAR